jgi:hypothetical protein
MNCLGEVTITWQYSKPDFLHKARKSAGRSKRYLDLATQWLRPSHTGTPENSVQDLTIKESGLYILSYLQ